MHGTSATTSRCTCVSPSSVDELQSCNCVVANGRTANGCFADFRSRDTSYGPSSVVKGNSPYMRWRRDSAIRAIIFIVDDLEPGRPNNTCTT